jgi:hypothetical protein
MSSIAAELTGTIQAASINRHPDTRYDLNPGTAASKKVPVSLSRNSDLSDLDDDEIPASVLRPVPRRSTIPPLPDLRFEQSYLKSIERAENWGVVAYITFKDQVNQSCPEMVDGLEKLMHGLGDLSSRTGYLMGASALGMEALERRIADQRNINRSKAEKMACRSRDITTIGGKGVLMEGLKPSPTGVFALDITEMRGFGSPYLACMSLKIPKFSKDAEMHFPGSSALSMPSSFCIIHNRCCQTRWFIPKNIGEQR